MTYRIDYGVTGTKIFDGRQVSLTLDAAEQVETWWTNPEYAPSYRWAEITPEA